jgi:DNA-binding transcriptional MerR regulator
MKNVLEAGMGKKEEPKLHGTFVNEIYSLVLGLEKGVSLEKMKSFLERWDTQEVHSADEREKMKEQIASLDEEVAKVNALIEQYNESGLKERAELKEDILRKCDELVGILYQGDEVAISRVKRSLRPSKVDINKINFDLPGDDSWKDL